MNNNISSTEEVRHTNKPKQEEEPSLIFMSHESDRILPLNIPHPSASSHYKWIPPAQLNLVEHSDEMHANSNSAHQYANAYHAMPYCGTGAPTPVHSSNPPYAFVGTPVNSRVNPYAEESGSYYMGNGMYRYENPRNSSSGYVQPECDYGSASPYQSYPQYAPAAPTPSYAYFPTAYPPAADPYQRYPAPYGYVSTNSEAYQYSPPSSATSAYYPPSTYYSDVQIPPSNDVEDNETIHAKQEPIVFDSSQDRAVEPQSFVGKQVKIRRKKDPAAPKNPKSAYLFFLTEQRALIPSEELVDFSEFAKDLGAKWRALTEEQKEPYLELARKDKERYIAERAIYGNRKVFVSSIE